MQSSPDCILYGTLAAPVSRTQEEKMVWMHHQHCYWLISSGLVIKNEIISNLLTPWRLSFRLFDLKCLLEGLAFAEFLKVDIKYLIQVEPSESIFHYSFAIRLESQVINAILMLISPTIQKHYSV